MKITLNSSTNAEVGSVILEQLWSDVFALKIKFLNLEAIELLGNAFKELLRHAKAKDMRLIMCRVIDGDLGSSEVQNALYSCGFENKNRRIEFRKEVSALPNNDNSPILWKSAEELRWEPEDLAPILKEISTGDPNWNPHEDPIAFMQDFLRDPILTSGLGCMHIGFLDQEIVAMTVVQINLNNGWSRISYMGVIPRFRNQGLGKWVHFYGFHLMKAEGGKLYVGGTNANNTAMIKLFERNGCEKFRTMSEWHCDLDMVNNENL